MRALEEERQQARELGRQINREARRNPNSPYAGKVIGILHGEVVIVADTLDEVAEVWSVWNPMHSAVTSSMQARTTTPNTQFGCRAHTKSNMATGA